MARDLNTDFNRTSLNNDAFSDLLFKYEGVRVINDKPTYIKGNNETNIDHVLLFDKTQELAATEHMVLNDPVSDHLALYTTIQTNTLEKSQE